MVHRNQRQGKTAPAREHGVVGDLEATQIINSIVHASAGAVCEDVAGGNAAFQTKIPTDGKTRDRLVLSDVSRNKENFRPLDEVEDLSHATPASTLSVSGLEEITSRTSSTSRSNESLSAHGDAKTGDPESAGNQIEQHVPGSESGRVPVETASKAELGRGRRLKKPSLRAQEAAQAAERQATEKEKARTSTRESKKRKRGSTELEESTDRDQKQRKRTSDREHQQRAGYSISALIGALTVSYFEVFETAKLREDAAQGLLQMSERPVVYPKEPRHVHAFIGASTASHFEDFETAELREDAAQGLLQMSERPRVSPKEPRHVDVE